MSSREAFASGTVARAARASFIDDNAIWSEVTSRLGASVLQSWEWGEFKARHGWTPFRLIVEGQDGPIIAGQVLGRRIGPLSVLYVPRGPMHCKPESDAWSAFTLAIDRLARRQRAAIVFMELEDQAEIPPAHGGNIAWSVSPVELQPLRTIKVRVDYDDDEILAQMKSKTRYNVRLASRRGVTVRRGTLGDIAPFYELLEETSRRDAFGIHSIEYYADMLGIFGDAATLLLAEHEGEIAAGAIILQQGDEAIYMFGASSQGHQRHMPTHLLQFEAMRWARERGCTWYDLWGIPPTDTAPGDARDGDLNVRSGLWGVYRFKQGFGGEIVAYPGVLERVYFPRMVGLWRCLRPGFGG